LAYTYSPNADFNGTDTFVVTVTDADGDTSDVTVTVTVNAVDETPTLNNQTISVNENIANGTFVYDVNDASTGTDLDVDGDAITYSITNGNTGGAFAIDPVTGVITVANSGALDFETNPTFTLEITGSDGSLSDTATVTINLNDIVNENGPAISDANVTIDENIANGTSIINLNDGTTSTDTDADGDTIAYSIVGGNGTGPGAFAINSSTGEITVNDSSQLDFETNPSFNLIIEATAGGDTDTATITINLNDLDEIAPANPIIDVIAGNDVINAAEDDAVVITGTAEANSTIDLTVSDGTNTVTRSVTTNGAGVWTLAGNEIDLSGFDQGGITITATATDAAGNTSGVTTATPVHDSLAPSAPGLNTISLDSGTPGDLITNDNTLIFTGNTEANATVEVFVDGISVGTTTADGAGNWSFDYSGTTLADGTYAVTTQATDTAGNTGALSTATNVTIDTTAPSSSANSLLTNDQRPQLTGTVDDPNATVVIDVGGQTGLVATNNGDGTWTLPDNTINPALAEGSYDVTVTTTDVAGNVDNNTISNALVIDTTAPVPTITVDPVTADNIINASEAGGTVNVTGTVSGEFNAGDTVTVTVNGNTYISTVTATGLFTVSVSGSDLAADTTADISVTTTDSAGNVGGGASTHTYVVDVTAPAPTITINTVAGDNILSAAEIGGPVNVSGSVGGSGFSAGDIVTIKVNGNTYTGTIDAGGNFTISVPGSDVQADPDVEASITLTDTAGNTGIANQTLTVTRASAPATDNGSGDDVEPVIENNNSVTSANSQARPSQNILGAQQGAVIDTVSRASSLGTTNALSAEGAVLDAVEGANLSRQGFGQNFDDNLADNVGLWESEGVRGFAVSFSLTEVGRSSDSLSSLFPLRQGIEDVNAEDQLVVKSILRDRTIFLEIDYTIESDPNLYASNVRVTMLDGSALPEWLRADDNGTLLSGEPPVGQEKLQLRIQITLSDETVIVRYVDVNVDSGEIASLQHISEQHVVGSGLFEDKLKLEASKFDSAADVVTKSFFN
ncbi:MAG: Ig-like domain-containing protein, partial [Gammaproteobacteria bacterium]